MNDLIESGALWYASRATGVVSLVLLTSVVLLGILVRSSGRLPGLPRFAVTDLHRNLSLLSVAFLAVHIAAVVVDPYVTIRWTQVVVPWGGTYRPLWVGLGTVTFDLLLALVITSLVRVRLGLRMWRAVHWLAYAAWPLAVIHGLGAGTDLSSGWFLGLTIGLVGAVLAALSWRIARRAHQVPRAERVARQMSAPGAPSSRRTAGADRSLTGGRS